MRCCGWTTISATTGEQASPSLSFSFSRTAALSSYCCLHHPPQTNTHTHIILTSSHRYTHIRSKQSTFLVVSHDADFLDSVCSDILHLDDAQINAYKGDYSFFESMRGKILAKKEKEYQLQMKTMKEFTRGNAMSQDKAEKKTLQKLNLSALKEKPKEYKVNFVLHAAEDDSPAIDMLDVSFGYDKSREEDQFMFRDVRLKVLGLLLFSHICFVELAVTSLSLSLSCFL
jgi:hypothetical protein